MEGSLNECMSVSTFPFSQHFLIAHVGPIELNSPHHNYYREMFRRVGEKEKSGVEDSLSQEGDEI